MRTDRIEFANSLRGLAAVMVMIAHLVVVFWKYPSIPVRFTNIPTNEPAISWFASFVPPADYLNFGPLGVAIFFLISGFVIPFSLRSSSPARFMASRAMRLAPTYAVCFTYVILMVFLGSRFFNVPVPFTFEEVRNHYIPGLRQFMNTRDIDAVVWTLEIEVLFYFTCAIALPIFRKRPAYILAAPLVTSGLTALAMLTPDKVIYPMSALKEAGAYIAYMFIGTTLYLRFAETISTRLMIGSIAVLSAVFTVLLAGTNGWNFVFIVAPNYAYGLALFSLCYRFPQIVPKGRFVAYMANISYPLYLVHAVPGYVILSVLLSFGVPSIPAIAAAFAIAIAVAHLVHKGVEVPTREWSRDIRKARRAGTKAFTA